MEEIKNMKTFRNLKISIILSAVLSLILYSVIAFQRISDIEFQYVLILLFSAQALLIFTVICIIFCILASKGIINEIKTKKIITSSFIAILVGCISFCIYGEIACYNAYTPENIINNEKSYVQTFFPYHDISKKKKGFLDVCVSHMPGTEYIVLSCLGNSVFDEPNNYTLEYFKSTSPILLLSFLSERTFSPLNDFDINVKVPGKSMEVNGVKLTAYVDGNDYAVLIKSFNKSVYASITNAPADELSIEDYATEIIRQTDFLETATKEKVFLDVPLSEVF